MPTAKSFPVHIKWTSRFVSTSKRSSKMRRSAEISIERPAKKANITIHTARPGIVIGKKGEDIEKLRAEVAQMIGMNVQDVRINISRSA